MKIAHLLANGALVGGTETHVFALAEEQRRRGDDVLLVHAHGESLPSEGIRVLRGGKDGGLPALTEFRPEVVHLHGSPFGAATERALEDRFPVVRSEHDHAFACSTGERWLGNGQICTRRHGPGCIGSISLRGCAHRFDLRPSLRSYARLGDRLTQLRSARSTVFYSDYVRSIALEHGVDPGRARTIPYFVRRPPTCAERTSERNVVFAGRIVNRKGLDLLLRSLAEVDGPWDRLLVAGDGWDRKRCEQLALRLGIAGRVDFLGWTPVAPVLQRAAVVVVPSKWPEPFGIVGIEAMAAAKPVIASDVGGIPEWLDDGVTGLLVPRNDPQALTMALSELLNDPSRSAELGVEGWRRVERFSAERHLEALDASYAEART